LKRKTLTRNLNELIKRTKNAFLPMDIEKIFVHGSYLRGEALPGDLDVMILGKANEAFSQLHEAFSSLSDCHDLVWGCYEKGMTVEDAFRGPLKKELEKRNIPIEWVVAMSWSNLFGRTNFGIPYMLLWDKVAKRLLTKGMKGIHIQIETTIQAFTPLLGRLHICQEIPLFAIWSSESPNDYVLEPTKTEYEEYLKIENEKLRNSLSDARVLKKTGEFLVNASLSVVPREELGKIAVQLFWNTPKYEVSEKRLRETLRRFGLPEDRVFTMKYRGSKPSYRLALNDEEAMKLKAEAQRRETINDMELSIRKILRKLVPKEQGKIDCQIWNLENRAVSIDVFKPAAMTEKSFRGIWEARGFKIEDYGVMYASKSVHLSLDSSGELLSSEIRLSLEVTK